MSNADSYQSDAWTYLQTPQFTISTKSEQTLDVDLELSVRYGAIDSRFLGSGDIGGASQKGLLGLKLHEVTSWASAIDDEELLHQLDSTRKSRLVEWLAEKLPTTRFRR